MINVSIIVPLYNAKDYLSDCLDSLINQSLNEIEIILVNDGSTDNSLEICYEYKNKDSRIIVISTNNLGPAAARNIGIDNARGEYIGFVDSDDWVDENMYLTLFSKAKKLDLDIVSCNFLRKYNDKTVKNKSNFNSGFYKYDDMKSYIHSELICSDKLTIDVPFNMVTKFSRSL
nr:glycosyltransferase [Neobacillus sp. Marseille-Q6967]